LVLAKLPNALTTIQIDIARRGFKIVAKNLHKRRFSAAISANQAVTVAVTKFNGDVFKQGLCPKLHGDIGSRNQTLLPEKYNLKKLLILYGFIIGSEFRWF